MFAYFEWLLLAFPLSGAGINAFLGRRLGRRAQTWVATGALIGSLFMLIPLVTSQVLRPGLVGHPQAIPWFRVWDGDKFLEGPLALRVDTLSVFAASVIAISGFALVAYSARHLPATGSRHLVLAALDAALAALLLVVLADNLMCLLLGWAISGWCTCGVAWALQDAFLPPVRAGRRSQTASSRRAGVVPWMLSPSGDLSLLFALGFLASLLPSWNVAMAPMLAQLSPGRVAASRELGAAALCWLLASLIRVGRPAGARFLDSGSGVADAAVYALSSGFPGVYLIVRGSPLATLALSRHLPGLSSWSQGPALPWWWFGIGAGLAMLGHGLVRWLSSPTGRLSAWTARIARLWEPVCSFCRRIFRPLIRWRAALPRSTGVDWARRAEETLSKLFREAEPVDNEPRLTLCFLLLGTLLVLAYLLFR